VAELALTSNWEVPRAETASTTSATPSAQKAQQQDEKFDWYKCWYPVAALRALESDAPNAVHLLGMRLVVWKDQHDTWRCFEDLCPHRLAPLSEGRIHESGQLQCSYHGWTFNEQGGCTSIPQIGDPKAHKTACSNNRACVKAYPTQVLQDMLWVYADSSPQTWAAAEDGGLGLPSSASPDITEKDWEVKTPWFQRDVPLSYDVIMENLTDPAHVPHSHHGVIGSRDADHRMDMRLQGTITPQGYSTLVTPSEGAGVPPYEITFTAPSLVRWERGPTLTLNVTPTRKGWCRVMVAFVGPKNSKQTRPPIPGLPPLVGWTLDQLDKHPWLQHIMSSNPIIDGDTLFMHAAERSLYERGDHTTWRKQYYMPASADVAVTAWRKWLDKFGDTLPVLPRSAEDLPPALPREQVFDRYNQHTKHCPDCKAALRNTEIAISVLAMTAAVAAGCFVAAAVTAAASVAGASVGPAAAATSLGLEAVGSWAVVRLAAIAACIAAAAGVVIAGLIRLRQQFIFVDYVHAEH
jgi:pheophorbide a oxygenase